MLATGPQWRLRNGIPGHKPVGAPIHEVSSSDIRSPSPETPHRGSRRVRAGWRRPLCQVATRVVSSFLVTGTTRVASSTMIRRSPLARTRTLRRS